MAVYIIVYWSDHHVTAFACSQATANSMITEASDYNPPADMPTPTRIVVIEAA